MKRKIIALVLLTIYTMQLGVAIACINEYGEDINGKKVMYADTMYHLSHRFPQMMVRVFSENTVAVSEMKLKEMADRVGSSKEVSFQLLSNLSVQYIRLGKADSALKILVPLARLFPKEYTIQANLGTAYELVGKNDSALKYIELGYKLNPESHWGSEWVHIEILKAKIKMASDPTFLETGYIFNFPFKGDFANLPKLSATKKAELEKSMLHLMYQLQERAFFIRPQDEMMAKVLLETGDLAIIANTVEIAVAVYETAVIYDPNLRKAVDVRKKYAMKNLSTKALVSAKEMALEAASEISKAAKSTDNKPTPGYVMPPVPSLDGLEIVSESTPEPAKPLVSQLVEAKEEPESNTAVVLLVTAGVLALFVAGGIIWKRRSRRSDAV